MGIPVSIVLIAIGAVLAFAVNKSPNGFNVHTVGWILMGVGLVGVLLTLSMWERLGWGRAGGGYRRRAVYDDGVAPAAPVAPRRRTVVEEDVADVPPAAGPPVDPPPY